MTDGIDRLAQGHAAGRVTRRRVLGVLLGASTSALVGGTIGDRLLRTAPHSKALDVQTTGRQPGTARTGAPRARAADAACPSPNVRRPMNGPNDCPNNRITKSGYTPTYNGCGSAGIGGYLVPDDFDDYSFTPACNNHDVCYGTCNANKDTCDSNFLRDMRMVCEQHFLDFSPAKHDCDENAWIYYRAVQVIGGGAYSDAQQEACDCCEPFTQCVVCGCPDPLNPKYYPNATDCTGDCRASLGCFTNICAPADPAECHQAWGA